MSTESKNHDNIDETLYSRQLYVIGHKAMSFLMKSKILVIGCDGLGQEICKNIILAGVNTLAIYDAEKVESEDLSTGFLLKNQDVGKNRSEAIIDELKGFNKYVSVSIEHSYITEDLLIEKGYNVVISCNQEHLYNIKLNSLTHKLNIGFIRANSSGLFFSLFVDAGAVHKVMEISEKGLDTGMVNDISSEGIVTLADGFTHKLYAGDLVTIEDSQGNHRGYKVVKRVSRTSFMVESLTGEKDFSIHESGCDYREFTEPKIIEHEELVKIIKDKEITKSKIVKCNYLDEERIHELFTGVNLTDEGEERFAELSEEFSKTKNLQIMPICSVLGGLAAQEAIKLASCKFIPLTQIFYYHCGGIYSKGGEVSTGRYSSLIKVVGKENFNKLRNSSIFMVGAGAIGCEHLKNLIMSGLCLDGRLDVTDMDSIEISNLNRQFLFREKDVGDLKSKAACINCCLINEDYHLGKNICHSSTPITPETENVFSDEFILKKHLLLGALDNVKARSYLDNRAVVLDKPFIDSGTLGTLGHVQVVLPYFTESYNSSVDAEDEGIPMCTLKSYPNKLAHAVEWAFVEFGEKFKSTVESLHEDCEDIDEEIPMTGNDEEIPMKVNNGGIPMKVNDGEIPMTGNNGGIDETKVDVSDKKINRKYLYVKSKEDAVMLAIELFDEYFCSSIKKLLDVFPADYRNKDGILFWSPPKKRPYPIELSLNDPLHAIFISSTARLFLQVFRISEIGEAEILEIAGKIIRREIRPKLSGFDSKSSTGPRKAKLTLEEIKSLSVIEFEKDSWHADFIYATANLRARNYKIPEDTKHKIIGIAGKIVPAIATTTAVISGLAILEAFKLIVNSPSMSSIYQEESITENKFNQFTEMTNSFVDLSTFMVSNISPLGPGKATYELKDKEITFNLWNKKFLPNKTIKELRDIAQRYYGCDVDMILYGTKIVWWSLTTGHDHNLDKKLTDFVNVFDSQFYLEIVIIMEDDINRESLYIDLKNKNQQLIE